MRFDYPDNELVVENTGHVIEVPIPADNGNTLRVGSSDFRLIQYHFHAPSEHTLDGQQFDLEAHLVHENAAGQLAVVGVFMDIGDQPNELVDEVFHNAPEEAGEETEVGIEFERQGAPARVRIACGQWLVRDQSLLLVRGLPRRRQRARSRFAGSC